MPGSRIDQVTILGAHPSTTVVMSWDSRQALLEHLERLGGAADIVTAFRAVGTSRPVKLTGAQKLHLLAVYEGWLNDVGVPGLPGGVLELRNALIGERDVGELDDH
jgi:hypothetical protein